MLRGIWVCNIYSLDVVTVHFRCAYASTRVSQLDVARFLMFPLKSVVGQDPSTDEVTEADAPSRLF